MITVSSDPVGVCGNAGDAADAGRLQLAVADESAVPLSIAVPEARVLGLPASDDPPDQVLNLARDADVIAIGPGLDDVGRTTELMHEILGAAGEDTAVVLDAYALDTLSKDRPCCGSAGPC